MVIPATGRVKGLSPSVFLEAASWIIGCAWPVIVEFQPDSGSLSRSGAGCTVAATMVNSRYADITTIRCF